MKVNEYRDLVDCCSYLTTEWKGRHQSDNVRNWVVRAEKARLELWAADCNRLTNRDKERAEAVRDNLAQAILEAHAICPPSIINGIV